jgi:hypothetical protein
MKTTCLALLGTFSIGIASAASTDWNELGRIIVHDQGERFMRDFSMGGPVEKLQLKADGNDIYCRSVQANFADGNSLEIFQGLLERDKSREVELSDSNRNLQSLTFQCGTLVQGSAQIDIVADVGQYRAEWQRNPDFDRLWAAKFDWDGSTSKK